MVSIPQQIGRLVMDGARLAFREVRTTQELQDSLGLRHRVYAETLGLTERLPSLDHSSQLEMDIYDLTSWHLALFARLGARDVVVGTLRIASERPSPQLPLLRAIVSANPTLCPHLETRRTAPLPMFSYLEQAESLRERYDRLVHGGAFVGEPGRLTVHPELLVAAGRNGLRLSTFLIECSEAFAWHVLKLDHVMMDCGLHLERMYRRFGFVPVPGVRPTYRSALDINFTVLEATPDSLPISLREHVGQLARQLLDTGEAVMDRGVAMRTVPPDLVGKVHAQGPAAVAV